VARKATLGDFLDFKNQQLASANSAFQLWAETDKLPPGTSGDILRSRVYRLTEQVGMVNNFIDYRASALKDEIMPDDKSFDEMNEGEQTALRSLTKLGSLDHEVGIYESEIYSHFEDEYQAKYGGKKFDQMLPQDEESAREDLTALDKMEQMRNEMRDFKPTTVPAKQT
jgi:hypothetical protein